MKKSVMPDGFRVTAIALLLLVALNALAAGYSFLTDPSGSGLGISTTYLRQAAPFTDYFIPGLILFSLIGVWSLIVALLVITKRRHYPIFVLAQGGILLGWIVIQLMMVTSFHLLHLVVGLTGVVLMAIGWRTNNKRIAW